MRLQRPDPVEAEAGLRAMKSCVDRIGGPGPAAVQIIAAAQRILL